MNFVLSDSRRGYLGQDLDFGVRHRSKRLLVGWHNIEMFEVPPVMGGLVYAAVPAFWNHFKSARCFLVGTSICFSYFLGLLSGGKTLLTSTVRSLAMLGLVVLRVGEVFRTVCFDVVAWYGAR